MNHKSIAVVGVVCCCALFGALRTFPPAEATGQNSKEDGDIFAKLVIIVSERKSGIETRSDTEVIRDARLVKIGDQYFIRGKGTVPPLYRDDAKYKWLEGVDLAYCWRDVVDFYVVTPEQLASYEATMKED